MILFQIIKNDQLVVFYDFQFIIINLKIFIFFDIYIFFYTLIDFNKNLYNLFRLDFQKVYFKFSL